MSEPEASLPVRRRKATRVGLVTSNRMQKSVVVRVDRTVLHKVYKRYVRRSTQFMAHDEKNSCKIGDLVEIVETRPLSARKRWRVSKIVRAAATAAAAGSDPGGVGA